VNAGAIIAEIRKLPRAALPGLLIVIGGIMADQGAALEPADTDMGPREAALVDACELARVVNLPKSWLMSQARQGKIPSIKVGKYIRFNIGEVETVLRCTKR